MSHGRLIVATVLTLLAFAPAAAAADAPRTYTVGNVRTAFDRAAVAGTGAAILDADEGQVTARATRREVARLRALGYTATSKAAPRVFPTADAGYHDYAEMTAQLQQVA